jgi:hypothetical protein
MLAWVGDRAESRGAAVPDLFATADQAIRAMRGRICEPEDPDAEVLRRAHRVGLSLAVVQVQVTPVLILGTPG